MLTGFTMLAGLSGAAALSASEMFTLMRPLLPDGYVYKISDSQLQQIIARITAQHVAMRSNLSPSNQEEIKKAVTAAVTETLGYDGAFMFEGKLKAAFERVAEQGYKLFQKGDPVLRGSGRSTPQVKQERGSERSTPQVKQETRMPLFNASPPEAPTSPMSGPQATGTGNQFLDNILGVVAGIVSVKQAKIDTKAKAKLERQKMLEEAYRQQQQEKNSDLVMYGLIGGGILVVGVIAYFALRKKGPA
jgi:hypothetical protein